MDEILSKDLRNKNVVVVGLGESGLDACILLNNAGAIASATDSGSGETIRKNALILKDKFLETETGGHTVDFIKDADVMVVSPGIPLDSMPVKYALEKGIPVIGEIELGYYFSKGPIIAVTGTNGKSTVVNLLGDILTLDGKKNVVCGNIGDSLCGEIDRITKNTAVVLEVSSFQLDTIRHFKPKVSCILNITEDHLERYASFDDYARSKFRIFENQGETDAVILNYDDPFIKKLKGPLPGRVFYYSMKTPVEGAFYQKNTIFYRIKGDEHPLFEIPENKLYGKHNIENIMAVTLMALALGVKIPNIIKGLKAFRPLAHRIEYVDEINGVEFIDDSKGTNVDSTKRALEAVSKRVILIAGGRDKGGDYLAIKEELAEKVKKVIVIGEAAPKISKSFSGLVDLDKAGSLEEAVRKGFESASEGEAVLLSPMCSSFDMFTSYKHRGEVFQEAVRSLKSVVKHNT